MGTFFYGGGKSNKMNTNRKTCPFTGVKECSINGEGTEVKLCEICTLNKITVELRRLNTTFKPVLEVRTGEQKTHAKDKIDPKDKLKPLG